MWKSWYDYEEKCLQNNCFLTKHHVSDENGNLRAAQKGMNGAFTDAEIREAVKTARASDNVLREALKGIQ